LDWRAGVSVRNGSQRIRVRNLRGARLSVLLKNNVKIGSAEGLWFTGFALSLPPVSHDREEFSAYLMKILRDHERDRGCEGIFRAKRTVTRKAAVPG
jgi:hypothetical protein